MRWVRPRRGGCVFLVALVVAAAPAAAQLPEQVLHDFSGYATAPGLNGLIQASDGDFYGTTWRGGAFNAGSIFRMTPAGDITTLHSFRGSSTSTTVAAPGRLLEGSDGNFYGMTAYGGDTAACGASGCGTIFRMTPEGFVTTLHAFHRADGSAPRGRLVQATDGLFYGLTEFGGSAAHGTIFRMDRDGVVVTLHHFAGGTKGSSPIALVEASDGAFYGVTPYGGARGLGTVFRMLRSGTVKILHSFRGIAAFDGSYPNSLIEGSDGRLYGTTAYGGVGTGAGCTSCGNGTIFRMTTAGEVTTIHAFTTDGRWPNEILQGADGWFYGTASGSGENYYGSLFRVGASGLMTLHTFGVADGRYPSIVLGRDGMLYGTTYEGGGIGFGTIFKANPTGTVSTVLRFPGSLEGAYPGTLVHSADSNFYGTTSRGGAYNHGTIFRMAPDGTTTVAYTFAAGYDGGYPNTLIQGTDGAYTGQPVRGVLYDRGTVFRFALDGTFTILYTFKGLPEDGAYPSSLIQGADGALYGTASGGGQFNRGTLFRLTPEGAITVLHQFAGGKGDGASPASIVQVADGSLYGTTWSGGGNMLGYPFYSAEAGTVFKLTPGGVTACCIGSTSAPGLPPACWCREWTATSTAPRSADVEADQAFKDFEGW